MYVRVVRKQLCDVWAGVLRCDLIQSSIWAGRGQRLLVIYSISGRSINQHVELL